MFTQKNHNILYNLFLKRPVKVENHLLYFPNQMVSDHEKSEITCLAAQDWKNFVQSRSKEMKKGKKKKKLFH